MGTNNSKRVAAQWGERPDDEFQSIGLKSGEQTKRVWPSVVSPAPQPELEFRRPSRASGIAAIQLQARKEGTWPSMQRKAPPLRYEVSAPSALEVARLDIEQLRENREEALRTRAERKKQFEARRAAQLKAYKRQALVAELEHQEGVPRSLILPVQAPSPRSEDLDAALEAVPGQVVVRTRRIGVRRHSPTMIRDE